MKLQTTLRLLVAHDLCPYYRHTLFRALGAGYLPDAPIDLTTLLNIIDIDGALWALESVLPEQHADRFKACRLFVIDCYLSIYCGNKDEHKVARAAVERDRRDPHWDGLSEAMGWASFASNSALWHDTCAKLFVQHFGA
jgi:hypothetical protein